MRLSRGGFRSADSNGDGLADFLLAFTKFATGDPETMLVAVVDDVAKPTGLDNHRWIASELNGDGRSDFVRIVPRESSTDVTTLVGRTDGTYRQTLLRLPRFENPSLQSWKVADVNGDGREDLVHLQCIDQTGRPTCDLQIDTFLSRGDGSFSQQPRTTVPRGTTDVGSWRALDLDGDGRIKLVYVGTSTNAGLGVEVRVLSFDNGWVDLGNKGPFQPPGGPSAARSVRNTLAWMAADVDGDGRSDLVYVNTNVSSANVTALLSRGANSWEQKDCTVTYSGLYNWGAFSGAGSEGKWRAFDVNGDGLTDLSRNLRTPNGIVVQTLFSVGNGSWQEVVDTPNLAGVAEAAAAAGAQDWHITDVNMDGRPDLVHLDRSPHT